MKSAKKNCTSKNPFGSQEKGRGGAPAKAPLYRPCGAVALPKWFESVMRVTGASVSSHSAPCLQTSVYHSLSSYIGKDKPLRCVEVKNMPCTDMLAREKATWHVHSGNNAFVGYVSGEETVYITCSSCSTQGVKEKPNAMVKFVKGANNNKRYQWLQFDETTWGELHTTLFKGTCNTMSAIKFVVMIVVVFVVVIIIIKIKIVDVIKMIIIKIITKIIKILIVSCTVLKTCRVRQLGNHGI